MVLLKGYSDEGFRFFTNYESRKGSELVSISLCVTHRNSVCLLDWLKDVHSVFIEARHALGVFKSYKNHTVSLRVCVRSTMICSHVAQFTVHGSPDFSSLASAAHSLTFSIVSVLTKWCLWFESFCQNNKASWMCWLWLRGSLQMFFSVIWYFMNKIEKNGH